MRAELLQLRRQWVDPGVNQRLLAVLEPVLRGLSSVAGYAPLRSEPGGPGLPEWLAARVPALLLPVLRPDNDLDWARYEGTLTTGPGLRHPPGPPLGVAAIGTVDLVLVPALAVARSSGVRLGRGGGSYDRVLTRIRPGTPALALLYPGELVDGVPSEPHDQRVSGVVTVDGLVEL
jgi:5-formyltetrahydrofolate cyclo-ligase